MTSHHFSRKFGLQFLTSLLPSKTQRRRKSAIRSASVEAFESRILLTTLTVNSAADNVIANDGLVTLREAIIAANTDGITDLGETGSGADEIVFRGDGTGGTTDFNDKTADTITLGGTELEIASDLIINGRGADLLTIDGNNSSRVFFANSAGDVTISGVTITGGNATNSGGGILNQAGTLTVRDSVVTGNVAGNDGGGLYSQLSGTLHVENSVIQNNNAGSGSGNVGGGIGASSGTLTISDSVVSGNTAYRTGGVFTYAQTTVINSLIDNNMATETVGGGFAGGINAGAGLTLINSTVSNNSSFGTVGGGGIRVFGGGHIENSTISGNMARFGAGIVHGSGDLTIVKSKITGNIADEDGGGIFSSSGTLHITKSKITDNSAAINGGGIFSETDLLLTKTKVLSNDAGNLGGGAFTTGTANISFTKTKFRKNIAGVNGGGLFFESSGNFDLFKFKAKKNSETQVVFT
ncbi:hypothetical protein KOR42_55300 [Thalassoglobus neptunius]|uniref:Uncharacterized protein n=1 Tax=Thalassoglobus neptunius TaxID=1938619 RepID=A0A5C5UUQ1_9PLAN|nr:CSLREA domain-containing protein [Thalassoglobus neptunius]TWT29357.1 hypothetical protein KOR42_55300 [Thalassoglobus neptunius]